MLNNEINLPLMEVEKRDSKNNWGIVAPDISKDNLNKELQLAIQLNQDVWTADWAKTTLDILSDYIPGNPQHQDIIDSVKSVMNHDSWKDCSIFVQDDMCADFFNRALHYCLKEGQPHKYGKGFIDGSGIGYLSQYSRDLKITLEKAFDVKYFYELLRPLEWALKQGLDLTRVANKIHPGHFSYVQGHMTKFLTAVYTLDKVFHLDTGCLKTLLLAAYTEGQARCGNLIHYPMDGPPALYLLPVNFQKRALHALFN